jgi:hypothetical protein
MTAPGGGALSPVQRAIVMAAAYSDLFDYPLTRDELRRYLTVPCPGDRPFEAELEALVPERLQRQGELFMLPGRGAIVELRRRRQRDDQARWRHAGRYAGWLRHVPFVRMVAVCGSQAAGNPRPDADVDFFLITATGRLWLAQICAMLLRRFASWLSVPVCPNYFLTLGSLEVAPRDLYHAREVAQAVPLWGGDAYRRFRAANGWVDELLPNLAHADDRSSRLAEPPRSRAAAGCEWLLGGVAGDLLERAVRALLLRYYAFRLRHLGWGREQLRRAYRADRQEVMRGGYGPVVERAFRQRAREQLPEAVVDEELRRLFPDPAARAAPDRLFARQFIERYGHGE